MSRKDLAAEYVGHLSECGGLRRGDDHCTCGAVALLAELEDAYAMLWAVQTSDQRVHSARRLLLGMIGRDGQRRGLARLPDWAIPTGPTAEMLADTLGAGR